MNLEKLVLGIELGSTRIKAVLIDENHKVIASGGFAWENQLVDNVWIYELNDAVRGIRMCYSELRNDFASKYNLPLTKVGAIGVSGMMHGYLVFDRDGNQLAPFRTWRNAITATAAEILSDLMEFNIPQRWSIAHLYQAILNGEEHIGKIAQLTTLSGYIHYLLTGKKVTGICEASGMFPYNDEEGAFDSVRINQFDSLVKDYGFSWKIRDILPEVLQAGEFAGELTPEGAALLDESGTLQPGIPFCPPEGDAGTGMIATCSITPRTGNISAGTSAFSMQVLERPLSGFYPEIDIVSTPDGKPVAMAHSNTCTSDIDAWIHLFADAFTAMGFDFDMGKLYSTLFTKALEGRPDCGGLLSYNYIAGETLCGVEKGRPMFLRLPDSKMNIADFMRTHLYSAVAVLRLGMDLLMEKEHVETDRFLAHGGFFKTPGVGQQILADALGVPITTMETAGEGGPWGMALLAAYMLNKGNVQSLENYLNERVFQNAKYHCLQPDPAGNAGFATFLSRYKSCLSAQIAAGELS